jgi:hypothetical protein
VWLLFNHLLLGIVLRQVQLDANPSASRSIVIFSASLHSEKCTLTCMNDLTGAKVLKGERILFNAFKDIYFTSKMKFENSLLNQAFKKVD